MKNIIIVFILLFGVNSALSAGVFVLEGVYQGRDLYVQNPFSEEGVGFCIYEVTVNGMVTSDEINSSAFAVDLSMYEFMNGDDIVITIRSKADCIPNIINPEAISPTSSCEFSQVALSDMGVFTWNTKGENGKMPFIIEHYKWNKWVKIGSVLGDGNTNLSAYEVSLNLPAGENTIRLKQKDYNGEHLSEQVSVVSLGTPAELLSAKVTRVINFSAKTHFELFNSYGELIETGFSASVNASELDKGDYYLNYEKISGKEIRKR